MQLNDSERQQHPINVCVVPQLIADGKGDCAVFANIVSMLLRYAHKINANVTVHAFLPVVLSEVKDLEELKTPAWKGQVPAYDLLWTAIRFTDGTVDH